MAGEWQRDLYSAGCVYMSFCVGRRKGMNQRQAFWMVGVTNAEKEDCLRAMPRVF